MKKINLTLRQRDGMFAILGALGHKVAVSSISVLSLLYPYMISICNDAKSSHDLDISHGFFMYPIYNIAYYCSIALGGFIDRPLGPTKTMSLGMLILILVGIGFYLSENIYLDYFLMFFLGLGIGFGDQVLPKNACYFFPDYKGTISTCIIAFLYLSSALFSYLAEQVYINPDGVDASKETGLYDIKIAEKLKDFAMFGSSIGSCMSLFAAIFTVKYNPEVHSIDLERPAIISDEEAQEAEGEEVEDEGTAEKKGAKKEEKKETNEGEETAGKKEQLLNKDDEDIEDKPQIKESEEEGKDGTEVVEQNKEKFPDNPEDMEGYLASALKSWRFWKMFVISICNTFVLTLGAVVYKPLGTAYGIKESDLQILVTGNLIITSIFTPISGFLSDKIKFKYIMLIISIGAVVFGVFIIWTRTFILYCIMVFLDFFLTGFAFAFPQHIMKVFGMKYMIELYGMIAVSVGLAYILSTLFAFIMQQVSESDSSSSGGEGEGDEEEDSSTLITALSVSFYLGAALAGVSVFLASFETDDKFVPKSYLVGKYVGETTDANKPKADLLPDEPKVEEHKPTDADEPQPETN